MFNLPNHMLQYRPLIGGIGVYNPLCNITGTLGLILTDGQDRWILSAHHVLGRVSGAAASLEPIWQPFGIPLTDPPVARLDMGKSDPALDYACAKIEQGIASDPWILGVGRPRAEVAPVVNMVVLKSGIRTGVTQGRVTAVNGRSVTIETEAAFPSKYDLSSIGDSGSVWVQAGTLAPVALHVSGHEALVETAYGVAITDILAATGLRVLV